jgi:hypothetical protein
MQKPEDMRFRVKRSSDFAVLEVDELSDHVFFQKETILLQLGPGSEDQHEFTIHAVEVQGSKAGKIHSIVRVNCGNHAQRLETIDHPIPGKTMAIDKADNVLIEFMLARALHLILSTNSSPHPCKIILPVFVDDISVVLATSRCLSTEVSIESGKEVKKCLLEILKIGQLSPAQEKKLIEVSVKDAVLFFCSFQGCQLFKGESRSMTMEAKAQLVCSSIFSIVGIEAAQEHYVSNNPLAHELLDFINQKDLGHIGRSLVKFDVTSLQTFSNLSLKSIETIANDSREISKKSEVREISDITSAICAAKASPLVMPVSQRLATFEDKDASFMTIIYSTFAMEQRLTKALFGIWFFVILGAATAILAALQFRRGEVGNATVNLARAFTSCLMLIILHGFKSIRHARYALFFGYVFIGISCVASVTIDQLVDGEIMWDYSNFCALNFHASKMQLCLQYVYVVSYWQGIFYAVLAPCILSKQEWVWRGWNMGTSVHVILNLCYLVLLGHAQFGDYLACVAMPSLLLVTEFLKFYGTLQAIQSTQEGKRKLTKVWDKLKQEHEKHLKEISKFVDDTCSSKSFCILNRSKDLGKWKVRAWAEPPKIRQPESDFDELYLRAVSLNDTFQTWIESFFAEHSDPSAPHFKGKTIRGPVKRPHRAIAKVCCCRQRNNLDDLML